MVDDRRAALGEKEVAATRARIGWNYAAFDIPTHVHEAWDARGQGAVYESNWMRSFAEYARNYPAEAREFERRMKCELPAGFAQRVLELMAAAKKNAQTVATRKASQDAIEGIAPIVPELIGGSADLAGSNLTL